MYKRTTFYESPTIEFTDIAVENGFNGSIVQLPDFEEDDDVIIIG